jgi:hypothetical protein
MYPSDESSGKMRIRRMELFLWSNGLYWKPSTWGPEFRSAGERSESKSDSEIIVAIWLRSYQPGVGERNFSIELNGWGGCVSVSFKHRALRLKIFSLAKAQ